MTITRSSAAFASFPSGSSITVRSTSAVIAGDLLVAVMGCYRATTGLSAGWTQFVSSGSTGQYIRAAWRIADGTTTDDLTYSLAVSGQSAAFVVGFRSTVGWDSGPITQYQSNVNGAHSTWSYALAGSLSGVTAGQLTAVIGGQSDNISRNVAVGTTGTGWLPSASSDVSGYGHAAIGTNTNTGTISAPSISFGTYFASIKFVVGFVLKETASAGQPGGGLFWGQ